ncbi:protein of unknown function (plasmid) [Cupriavidus taiwanensis]|uniref:Uncharacterized protein n=1 Tax=Cupriavidus taiwanensis TaxID=164546 RepID=A0A7Z7JCU2_9BURK|nr:protein of unknown function [Cupriavidus taiwanensis]SOZ12121.1 protein of unknown function [Cupriavidus taiwanensis]SOZ43426.1 protein of unknown function [Cupriavidus taiwanensis]SPC22668.1 protein of unknown function [Cupriavidus taiwanensis]SPD54179.1 protein of unknown function [Cupriavidus taiwanensis]
MRARTEKAAGGGARGRSGLIFHRALGILHENQIAVAAACRHASHATLTKPHRTHGAAPIWRQQ